MLLRRCGIGFQLAAQLGDVGVDGAAQHRGAVAHTSVRSSMRLTTAPPRRSSATNRIELLGVRPLACPYATQSVSRDDALTTGRTLLRLSGAVSGGAVRRNSASTRASSSSTPNGFVNVVRPAPRRNPANLVGLLRRAR